MTRFTSALSALLLCASVASGIIVDSTCGNTLVSNTAGACIRDHTFTSGATFDLTGTKVKTTKFNGITFKGTQSFTKTEWSDVEFNNCKFLTSAQFDNGQAKMITFNKCTFDAATTITFLQMTMENVKFVDCTFNGDVVVREAATKGISFSGGSTASGKALSFESATTTDLSFKDVAINGNLQFRNSKTTGFKMTGKTALAKELQCNKIDGGKVNSQSTFKSAEFTGTTFLGFQCQESTWDGMKLKGVKVQKDMAFNGANLKNIDWDGIDNGVGSVGSCKTRIDVSYGRISDGDKIDNVKACNVSLRGVVFNKPIDLSGLDIKNRDVYNLKDAIFAQTCVGKFSCTAFCGKKASKTKLCTCAEDKESNACDKKGSNVDVDLNEDILKASGSKTSEKKKGCFPADSIVQVQGGAAVRMFDLQHSDNVAIGDGKHSEVFFFGHKHATEMANFVHIYTEGSAKPLRLSPGHYLYANGKLATARTVVVGDDLETGDGKMTAVTSVRVAPAQGLYAPTTMHGNIVVDGIVVSSYTDALHPRTAHNLLAPLRALHHSGLSSFTSRFTVLHSWSAAPLVRLLGFGGPATVEMA